MNSSEVISSSKIDSAVESKDHLTALPSELQHLIIEYLYPTHDPEKAAYEPLTETENKRASLQKVTSADHPLDYLAATCKTLRHEIMAWSRIFLTKNKGITKYKPLKTSRARARHNFLRGRVGLLTWSEKNCVFCGEKTSRSAILMNGLSCCAPCDKEQWPGKITLFEAMRVYHLKDHHLLPGKDFTPSLAKMLAKHPGGLPKLRYGSHCSFKVTYTMFLRSEVEALAKFAHGDLREHLAKKQAARRKQQKFDDEASKDAKKDSSGVEPIGNNNPKLREHVAAQYEDPMLTASADDFCEELIPDEQEMIMPANESLFDLDFVNLDGALTMGGYESFSMAAL